MVLNSCLDFHVTTSNKKKSVQGQACARGGNINAAAAHPRTLCLVSGVPCPWNAAARQFDHNCLTMRAAAVACASARECSCHVREVLHRLWQWV